MGTTSCEDGIKFDKSPVKELIMKYKELVKEDMQVKIHEKRDQDTQDRAKLIKKRKV